LYPAATHNEPFHASPKHTPPEKISFEAAVQFIPSKLYPNVVVPLPPATHTEPFEAAALILENIESPLADAIQVIPS
jgi:hypothetical protein